jgi:hypothetical protein
LTPMEWEMMIAFCPQFCFTAALMRSAMRSNSPTWGAHTGQRKTAAVAAGAAA